MRVVAESILARICGCCCVGRGGLHKGQLPSSILPMEVHWALRYLPALLWPLFLLSSAFELNLRSDWYAPYLFERLHVYEQVADADELHAAVYACYFETDVSEAQDLLSTTRFGQYERLHFQDVARLLSWNRIVCVLSLLLLIVLSIWHPLRYQWMRLGSCYVIAGMFAVILMSSRWLLFFRGMHPLLFSHGHWDFHPNDLILQLYPEMLLGVVAASVIGLVFGLTFIVYVLGWYFDKTPLFQGVHWRWYKRLTDICLVVALFAVPAWISGRGMIFEGGNSWLVYWLICLSLLVVCCMAVALKNLAHSLLIVAAAMMLLQGFAEGVSNSTLRAQYCLDVFGANYRDAIEAYKNKHQALPSDLDVLREFALTQDTVELAAVSDNAQETNVQSVQSLAAKPLPIRFDHFGKWVYVPDLDGHYVLYFKGPLAFEFSYHSRSDYWNSMRLP